MTSPAVGSTRLAVDDTPQIHETLIKLIDSGAVRNAWLNARYSMSSWNWIYDTDGKIIINFIFIKEVRTGEQIFGKISMNKISPNLCVHSSMCFLHYSSMEQKIKHIVVGLYKNNSERFDIGHCPIISRSQPAFKSFSTIQPVRPYITQLWYKLPVCGRLDRVVELCIHPGFRLLTPQAALLY